MFLNKLIRNIEKAIAIAIINSHTEMTIILSFIPVFFYC